MNPPSASHALTHPRSNWFVISLLVCFVGLSVQYTFKALANRSAIERWLHQLVELGEGVDVWDLHNYPNPPIMALMLEPLAKLPPLVGALLWFYLKVGMAAFAILWTFRLIESPERPFPAWGKALAVLLSLRPIMGDLTHGNINLFILFLVVGALYAFHRRRDLVAGVSLALGIACKVTPALFVPYFAWKRGWKTLLGCAVGLVLFFWLVPGAFLGMRENAQYLESWVKRMILPFVVGGDVTTEYENQSLPAVVHRLLTDSPSFTHWVDNVKTPLEYHNVLSLSKSTARWILQGCMGLFVLLVVWVCRTPAVTRSGWRLAAEFSLVVLGMLLFSERTWKHHCVTLLLPFSVLAYYLSACRPGPALRAYLIATLGLVVLLMTTTGSVPVGPLERASRLAQVYGAYVWAYLLLIAALAVLLRRGEGSATCLQASISETTEAPGTSGIGLPVRSVKVVSGSMPSR
jgi:hypothetical protein